MDCQQLVLVGAVLILGVVALVGFFRSKTDGYGTYTTGTLLLILLLTFSALLAVSGALDSRDISSILLAVAGFIGGLFANKLTQSN